MSLSLALAWLAAHPFESLALIGAVLSVVNGALPASVQSGPVGRVLHAVLDRLAVLSRSDAQGTLKWPGVASALLSPVAVAPPSVGPLAPPVDPVAPALPTPVEPLLVLRAPTLTGRETIAPAEVSQEHYESVRDGVREHLSLNKPAQGGHVEGAAMLGACVLALAASLLCAGCPWVREGAMRASVIVTDPRDCIPLATRCVAGVPVVCSPSPVPGSVLHREWPILPRDGRGMQRACSGGCVVDDAGAHCVVADAAVDASEGGAL